MVDPNNIKIETAFDKFVSDHYYGRWSNLIKAISQHYNMDTKPVLQDVMRHWKKPRKRKSYAYHMVEKYMREVHDVEIDNLIAIRADATADRQTELPIGPKNDTDDMLERIYKCVVGMEVTLRTLCGKKAN